MDSMDSTTPIPWILTIPHTPFLRNLHIGFHMDSIWTPWTPVIPQTIVPQESMWNPHILPGIHKESMWNPYWFQLAS